MTYDTDPKLTEFWREALRIWKTYDIHKINNNEPLDSFDKLATKDIITKRNEEKELLMENSINSTINKKSPKQYKQYENVESLIYSAINKEYFNNGSWPSVAKIASVTNLSEQYVHQLTRLMANKKKVVKYYNANEGFQRVRIAFVEVDEK